MPTSFLKESPLAHRFKPGDAVFWSVFLLLVCLFFLIKYQGPQWVGYLYDNGIYSVLNKGLGVSSNQSRDFYLGVADNRLLGPLSSLAAGGALLMFCWRFLKEDKGWGLGTAVLIYLFLTRLEALWYPPYGDALGGIFTDVMWIVRHNFDHIEFLFNQKTLGAGGYKQYPLSIYPSFLAFLIMITPTAKAFLAAVHSLTFLMGSMTVVIFRKILSEVFDRERSLLIALSMVALPLFQSMAENINMEMASTFFSILAIYYLVREKLVWAALMAVAAFFVKATGIITCATVCFGCVMLFWIKPERLSRGKIVLCGLGMAAFAGLMAMVRTQAVGPQTNTTNVTQLLIGAKNIQGLVIFKVFCAAAAVFLFRVMFWLRKRWNEPALIQAFLREHFLVLLMLAMSAAWFGLYANFLVMIHRYKLLIAPFLITAAAIIFLPRERFRKTIAVLLTIAVLFSFFCSHGLLYRNSPDVSQNEFEGSLEYRNELKLMMRLAQKIDEEFSGFLVGAPYLMVQALYFHEIGFVNRPLDVMVYGHFSINEGVKTFEGLAGLDLFKTVWVGFYKDYFANGFYDFPVGEDDKILYEMEVGDQKGYIFLGGFAIERRRLMVQRARILIELHKQGKLPPEYEGALKGFLNVR